MTTVFLLETLQAVLIARDMFEAFARGFGDPSAITGLHFSGLSAPIIGGTGVIFEHDDPLPEIQIHLKSDSGLHRATILCLSYQNPLELANRAQFDLLC